MRIKFWGTRGSIPMPGIQTIRYGGNTPCIELRLKGGELVILDAGTGIRNLGEHIVARGETIHAYLLISHPHWDHIQGFPFFQPVFHAGHELTIVGGETDLMTLERMIADQMNKVYFPIQLNELKARLTFKRVREEEFEVFGALVRTIFVNHPVFALGYRIEQDGKSIVYISDNEPFDKNEPRSHANLDRNIAESFHRVDSDPNQRIIDFAEKADVLIHDATYTPEEYGDHIGWGHSPYDFPLRVAAAAQVKTLVLFHHDPTHTDEQVDNILASSRARIEVEKLPLKCLAAAEGMELEV